MMYEIIYVEIGRLSRGLDDSDSYLVYEIQLQRYIVYVPELPQEAAS